jgi:16S rRNA (adenine1518-N6/adenine1519-N6)-dimethyltransferase
LEPRRSLKAPGAKKSFGQHFLERAWAEKVVRAAALEADDVVLEIGPGRGAITHLVAAHVAQVVAFEIDRDLAPRLKAAAPPNVRIVEGDFLEQTADGIRAELLRAGVQRGALRAVGNLPYNVASPILFKLLALRRDGLPIEDAQVMLQREVADRLTAPPGTKDYGVLSVLIRHHAEADRVLALPPGAFRPPPKVHSAVVRLRFHQPDPAPRDPDLFAAMTKAIFTRRRKTLANALRAYRSGGIDTALQRAAIDGRRRPETLTIGELVQLADALSASSGDSSHPM